MSKAKEFLNNLNEASLNRIYDHMKEYDTGTITANRKAKDCGDGEKYTREENKKRNKSLLAKLQSKGYGVISVRGSYIENYNSPKAVEVGENVFFVFDLKNKGKLRNDLVNLGIEFDQDSILFIPKGGESAVLIGTNHCPYAYPGYAKTIIFNKRQWGKTGEFFTRVKGRPFLFESNNIEEIPSPKGFFGKWSCYAIAKLKWEEIE